MMAEKAVKALNDSKYKGRNILVDFAVDSRQYEQFKSQLKKNEDEAKNEDGEEEEEEEEISEEISENDEEFKQEKATKTPTPALKRYDVICHFIFFVFKMNFYFEIKKNNIKSQFHIRFLNLSFDFKFSCQNI